jgi:hypothetical protein
MASRKLIVLAVVLFSLSAVGQTLMLGVLEDVPGEQGQSPNPRIRVVFRKEKAEWLAIDGNCPDEKCLNTIAAKFPSRISWTIVFDGHRLGEVSARTPSRYFYYAEMGLQDIEAGSPIPRVGKQSSEFGGYTERAVFRPLVAISRPYFTDPEGWKPWQLTADVRTLLRSQFRQNNPKVCRISSRDETKLEPFEYRDEEMEVVKSYQSRSGWTVARVHLGGAIECDDVEAGFEIDDQWFVITPEKSVSFLDSGMWLVDAGDYDNDGKSELLFAISRDNRGGYVLYYEQFKKHSSFEYGYH